MLKKLSPVLYTLQLQESLDFYLKELGFSCLHYEPEWGWASIQLDDVHLMLSKPNDHLPFEQPLFTGSFYIYTDQVDELWEKWADKLKIAYPIENFDHGMREFAIYDNNGYMLQFGQEVN